MQISIPTMRSVSSILLPLTRGSASSVSNSLSDRFMTCDMNEHCLEEPRAQLDHNVQPECDFFDEPFDEIQPTGENEPSNEAVPCQLIRPRKQLFPDPVVELGNAHWQELGPTTTFARAMHYDELTPQDIAFFNSRTKKLNFLDENITEDPNSAFPKPPVEWRNVQPAYRPGFVQPPQMQFLPPPPPFNHPMHLGPPPPPPQMQNAPYGINPWQTPEQAAYMHTFNLQRLKLVREQREAFSRAKKSPKKGGKKPKKPILRRRGPEIQRQTPSRELLAAPIQKRISAITASAVSQGGGFSGFCGVLKVNPLYPDCRGRVSTIKELDGITYFECANCGTRRRFLEEDEEPRSRR